jgi:hypothetical protein
MTLHESDTDFISAHPIKLIDTYTDVSRLISCFNRCHINICCRTFVNDLTWPFICRLYENLINTETIINLLSSILRVDGIHYNPSYYIYNNQIWIEHIY